MDVDSQNLCLNVIMWLIFYFWSLL